MSVPSTDPAYEASTRNREYRFYCLHDPGMDGFCPLPGQYSWAIWTPPPLPGVPLGLPDAHLKLRFHFRWLVSRAYRFPRLDCGALLIRDHGQVVHYSAFTPRYWRFPFMADEDLQIGDTWTKPDHRGNGLAFFALQTVVAIANRPGRRFWYVVGSLNQPSIRVVEKAGFALVGWGKWIRPFGIKMFGSYAMLERRESASAEAVTGASVSA